MTPDELSSNAYWVCYSLKMGHPEIVKDIIKMSEKAHPSESHSGTIEMVSFSVTAYCPQFTAAWLQMQ